MPLAHWNGKTIGFAHVPKAGGTSIEDYLLRRFGPLSISDVNKRTGIKHTGLIVPATHLSKTDLAELLPHDLTYGFAVVRDPLNRLMSEYRYQSKVSRMSRLGFSTWVRVMLRAATIEPRLYENHIRPQSDLVPDSFEAFRLEDGFDKLISKLDDIAGCEALDFDVQHLNMRKSEKIHASRQDIALVKDFYQEDYLRFGYVIPDEADYPNDQLLYLRNWLAALLAPVLVMWQRYRWVR